MSQQAQSNEFTPFNRDKAREMGEQIHSVWAENERFRIEIEQLRREVAVANDRSERSEARERELSDRFDIVNVENAKLRTHCATLMSSVFSSYKDFQKEMQAAHTGGKSALTDRTFEQQGQDADELAAAARALSQQHSMHEDEAPIVAPQRSRAPMVRRG